MPENCRQFNNIFDCNSIIIHKQGILCDNTFISTLRTKLLEKKKIIKSRSLTSGMEENQLYKGISHYTWGHSLCPCSAFILTTILKPLLVVILLVTLSVLQQQASFLEQASWWKTFPSLGLMSLYKDLSSAFNRFCCLTCKEECKHSCSLIILLHIPLPTDLFFSFLILQNQTRSPLQKLRLMKMHTL